jgi:hypothetical protein
VDITWQEIADKIKTTQSKKLVRETVLVFYSAFESNIDYECNVYIRNIGRFKGTPAGVRRRDAIKRHKKPKLRFIEKHKKRKQRLWVKIKFDAQWID